VRSDPAVWITGVGACTPLGNEYDVIADSLRAGKSGVRPITHFHVTDHPSQIAAQIGQVPLPPGWRAETFLALDPLDQLTLWCVQRALRDSGWWERRQEVRLGIVIGMGGEWPLRWERDFHQGGQLIRQPWQDAEPLVSIVQRHLGSTGPAISVSAACASGNQALALARRWIQSGWVDICLAGACDRGVTPICLAAFGNLRALSRRNGDPQAASRPFDRDRDGFVLGEGGAMFVLERAESARRRGARVYAEIAGCGASSDAHHMVIPSPDPKPAATAIQQALTEAGVAPHQIDYINAHATGTPVGDACETAALEAVLGDSAPDVPISSSKSMTGHLLSAAGGMEALVCMIAMNQGFVPPTINLESPDAGSRLCHVCNEAREWPIRVAVSNSFGFGGCNTSLVLRAV
jgi:3-oxoacyl-[acyl-carrier-protein] synthase II